jgi:hypothetical protein
MNPALIISSFLATSFALVAAFAIAQTDIRTERVRFEKGANTANYFNILAPGENQVAMFNGSIAGSQYEGSFPKSGDYKVCVYMMLRMLDWPLSASRKET